jgi:protein-glutamine gamma-glutamyltransferase
MKINVVSLCSFALGLWGIQTGLWFLAVPMILLLEGRHFIQRRWDLSLKTLKSIFFLCGAVFLVLLGFLYGFQPPSFIYSLLQCLPICIFPLIVAQTYSPNIPLLLHNFFSHSHSLRPGFARKQNSINLYYPYFALCLLSASATNVKGLGFYVMAATLVATMLRKHCPQRSHPMLWVCLILLVSGMGFVGHLQLHQLQGKLEQQTAPWLSGLSGDSVDPYQANTRMGSIEDLKQSNAIVFRVAGGLLVRSSRPSFPLLLREATYNKYGSASWVAMQSKFAPVRPGSDRKTWNFGTAATPSSTITVSSNLNGRSGILKLPNGTSEIAQLPVDQMQKNQYGTVKVESKPGAISYQIHFNPEQSGDSPPTEDDLQIPDAEKPAIQQTLKTLNLQGKPGPEFLDQVSSYFEKNFRYSLKRSDLNQSSTPLSTFLLKNKSGHCEYFASATTLLLRGAGIPARYAVGYSVSEFSPLEEQYVVRSRHAHAWVMAYVNGTWKSLDTTPPDWTAQEDASVSPLQAISDWWAFLSFKLVSGAWVYLGWMIFPVTAFFLWKWSRKFRVRRSTVSATAIAQPIIPAIQEGLDSEFYLIEQSLDELNLKRIDSEPLQEWMTRLKTQLSESDVEILRSIITLHNRYRFDPHGIEAKEREELSLLSQAWLDKFHSANVTRSK